MSDARDNAGRFRAGQTGNAKGRPKKVTSLDTILKRAANEKVSVTEKGRRKKKTKIEVAATQLMNQGAGGDQRAIKMTFDHMRKMEERDASAAARAPVMTRSDHEIAALLVERIRRALIEGAAHEEP